MALVDRENLESMTMSQLRHAAHAVYRVRIERNWSKSQIIDAIMRAAERRESMIGVSPVPDTNDVIPPGKARIMILPDESKRNPREPVYVNINSHSFLIPRGVQVDVPVEVVEVLRNAVVRGVDGVRPVDASYYNNSGDFADREAFSNTGDHDVYSYPFQLFGMNPLPGDESLLKERIPKEEVYRYKYAVLYNTWPTDEELREFMKDVRRKNIKLDEIDDDNKE